MVDVELEVIDLSTGQSVGNFSLTICEAKVYELDIGSYRFKATYLATGEVKESDRSIVEGVNPPLDFTFIPTYALSYSSTPISVPLTLDSQQLASGQSAQIPAGIITVSVPPEVTV